MARLIVLIGIPGSGKSSLAGQLQPLGYRVISTDQIRAQLFGDPAIQGRWPLIWAEVERQLQTVVQTGLAVYDATNTKRRGRRQLIRLARSLGFEQVIGFWLHPPLALCLERNQQRERQVPDSVIRRMERQLWSAPPKLAEGFDSLLYDRIGLPDWRVWLEQVELRAPSPNQLAPQTKDQIQFQPEYGNCTKGSAKTEPSPPRSLVL
jgi:predicted kinase